MNWYFWGAICSSLRIRTYSYSCKILQPYVAATVRIHSDAIFSSIGAYQIRTFIKILILVKKYCFFINNFLLGFGSGIDVIYKEPRIVDEYKSLMNIFIREALIEKNTGLECIRTMTATYGCNILRLIQM